MLKFRLLIVNLSIHLWQVVLEHRSVGVREMHSRSGSNDERSECVKCHCEENVVCFGFPLSGSMC